MTLSGTQVQQTACDTAASLDDVSNGRPFTPHLDVWKVRDKVFLIVTDDDPDLQIITVKVDPNHGDALRRDFDTITVGYYLDKQHWISVGPGSGITKRLVQDLVHGSYDLAADHHPKPQPWSDRRHCSTSTTPPGRWEHTDDTTTASNDD